MELLLAISLISTLIYNVGRKYYSNTTTKAYYSAFSFNFITALVTIIVLLCWGGTFSISLTTALLGAGYGVLMVLSGGLTIVAFQKGPMSLSNVVICFSTVLTALSGKIFWGEQLFISQIIGIVLMLISFIFIPSRNSQERKASISWFILCIFLMFCSCGIGLFQKIHQASNYKLELKGFLTTAFIVVAVVSLIISLIMGRKNAFSVILNQNKKINVKPIITMIIVGATTGVVHRLNLYLAGVIPSAIFFPVVNGGSIILCTIAAFIIFKEKLQKLQWIGLIVGIIALAFLCFKF